MVQHAKSSTLDAIIIHLISRLCYSVIRTDQSVHIMQHEVESMPQNPLKSLKWLQAVGSHCITSHMSTSGRVQLADPGGEEAQLRQRGGGSQTHGTLNRNQTAAGAAFSTFWCQCVNRMLLMFRTDMLRLQSINTGEELYNAYLHFHQQLEEVRSLICFYP